MATRRQIKISAIARRLETSGVGTTDPDFRSHVFAAERDAYGTVETRSDHQYRLFIRAVRDALAEIRFNAAVAARKATEKGA